MSADTSFGKMVECKFPAGLLEDFQVMQFDRHGQPHHHDDKDEVAICIHGSGSVMIDSVENRVEFGNVVIVPVGSEHYMIPDAGGLSMLIAYREPTAGW